MSFYCSSKEQFRPQEIFHLQALKSKQLLCSSIFTVSFTSEFIVIVKRGHIKGQLD